MGIGVVDDVVDVELVVVVVVDVVLVVGPVVVDVVLVVGPDVVEVGNVQISPTPISTALNPGGTLFGIVIQFIPVYEIIVLVALIPINLVALAFKANIGPTEGKRSIYCLAPSGFVNVIILGLLIDADTNLPSKNAISYQASLDTVNV